MSTWRKENGSWSRSFRRRPCFWWSHDTCLTSQPDKTRGPKAEHPCKHFHWRMTEAFATVDMPIASKKRASLLCKVDTGVGGNVMPLQAFGKLFPNQLTNTGMSTGLQKYNTKLRAYNRTFFNSVYWTQPSPWRMRKQRKLTKWTLLSISPIHQDQPS